MNRILSASELALYQTQLTPSGKVRALLAHQWEHFPIAKSNHDALSGVREKQVVLDGLTVRVQFNSARIVSSAAKVDAKSISERKCFLCEANLPVEQRALPFGENYLMLSNPFLIFPEHLTIPHVQHTDQRILGRMGDMLALSKELSDFVVFYNGPKCGASAPDHFHFQAGNKGFVPLETELETILNQSQSVVDNQSLQIFRSKPFGANAIFILSEDPIEVERAFEKAYYHLALLSPDELEPMLNLLSWMVGDRYCLVLFPRRLHRPSQFFVEGDANILLSPASVDLAGVFITPQEKDFEKITAADLHDILSQIMVSDAVMEGLCEVFY
ncbi:MAG: DUF4922 domain-containing protein [Bacteroidales bacterium]|nr:DUF4922 domain-containing protein [Bacteroidales bacterium]